MTMMNMELSRLMNAYRGQEDKLRQRVQLSNDLLELIAYEQLTREKRKLMAEKQAQAMPPGGLPTLRDQKEKEAFDLTKQELASQIGETIQQQDAQRRQAMMRSGLPAAPGAQNVMPEQAMAAGGIVAFQTGDVVSSPQTIAEQIADLYRQGKGFGDIE
jgi:alkanesulfonate monooxygenase SsuD/methylene tetrahydromethanopterin reductase-like flavin-dependent oxidoreductase (luciferase family)